jgi:flagellar L-ring protein precursor FlgH
MTARTNFGLLLAVASLFGGEKKPSPLDAYIARTRAAAGLTAPSAGSLYDPNGRLGDLIRDLRAYQVGDVVTIVVSDRASSSAQGTTASSRSSSASAGLQYLLGTSVPPALRDLLGVNSNVELDSAGKANRSNVLTATLTATVVDVMPNGYLIVEGSKEVQANTEKQRITVRGIVRWNDITPGNIVRSDRVGEIEIAVEGKGVVPDATRRPNFLYRLLLGILPF